VNGHLGPLAAALVDEQLEQAERDRALRHIAGCDRCRADVDQQRKIKSRLAAMSETQLPSALLDRLHALRPTALPPVGGQQAGPVPAAHEPTAHEPAAVPFPAALALPDRAAVLPRGLVPAHSLASPMRRRTRRVLVGAASLVLAGTGAAYAAGGTDGSTGAPVRPAVDVYTLQHGTAGDTVPMNDPAVSAVTVGYGR
jgi:anti-sigma factor RsiW